MIETNKLYVGDCLKVMRQILDNSVDLVFGSPPYSDCRSYGIDFDLTGQEYVDWLIERTRECVRVCKGLVGIVIQGKTRKHKWDATPALLMADLHRAGFNLRRPVIFQRFGVPGSGGKEWLKCNHEYVVCVTKPGPLPWSDNTACGHVPKYGPGGPCSNRKQDGSRVNQWGGTGKQTDRRRDGQKVNIVKPSHVYFDPKNLPKDFAPPNLCNPGDVIDCGAMGKGHMGSALAHETDAPFPEKLAEFFIKSFCPPQGVVLDPFLGSGTTVAVAKRLGRGYVGIDVRQSQIDLTIRRLEE
jgi:hypothetical protein